jgi:hypothetical protein
LPLDRSGSFAGDAIAKLPAGTTISGHSGQPLKCSRVQALPLACPIVIDLP